MSLSQADRLRSQIEDEIISAVLKPGERLDETRLAERYGTSRTPVREALRQLASNGLIEIRPHKGAIVAKLGVNDLVELFEVMAELEGACGKLAARACLKSDIDALEGAQASCIEAVQTGNAGEYAIANEAFHTAMYHASHNSCLMKMTIGIRNRVAPYRRLQFEHANRLTASCEEHGKILQAIKAGSAEETDRLIQSHVINSGMEIRRFIPVNGPSGFESRKINGSRLSIFESVGAK